MLVQGENGVAKDPVAAKAQFERAAAKNHPGALYNLGVMALQGLDGKTPDYKQAAQYFLRAANAGDDDAAYSYGVMLRDGKGAPAGHYRGDPLAQARGRRRHRRRPGRIRHHAVQWRGRERRTKPRRRRSSSPPPLAATRSLRTASLISTSAVKRCHATWPRPPPGTVSPRRPDLRTTDSMSPRPI